MKEMVSYARILRVLAIKLERLRNSFNPRTTKVGILEYVLLKGFEAIEKEEINKNVD